jgi:hypothetical protein
MGLNYKSRLKLVPAVGIMLLAGSCAVAPTRKFVRTEPGYDQALQEASAIGIVSDACLVRDGLGGKDYISVEDSRQIEQYMLGGAAATLESKGYLVPVRLFPLVGGFKATTSTFSVADRKGGQVTSRTPPFYDSDTTRSDAAFGQAITAVTRRTLTALEQKSEPPSDVFRRDELTMEHLKVIRDRTKVDRLLVIIGNGRKISGTKSAAQGCGTTVLSLVCSGGMFAITAHEVSAFDTYMALINLDSGRIVWANDLRLKEGDPTERGYYAGRWAKQLLYHFPARTGSS